MSHCKINSELYYTDRRNNILVIDGWIAWQQAILTFKRHRRQTPTTDGGLSWYNGNRKEITNKQTTNRIFEKRFWTLRLAVNSFNWRDNELEARSETPLSQIERSVALSFFFVHFCDSETLNPNMYKLLGGLREYFKAQEVQIDNAIFRLHNVFTTVLLLACSLVITATQYVGQPISCIVNGIPTHVVNTYCWISSTFTMPDAFQRQVSFFWLDWIGIARWRGGFWWGREGEPGGSDSGCVALCDEHRRRRVGRWGGDRKNRR